MHCDIKSTNVMLDSKCNAMLGYFGAAMFLDQPDLALQTRKMVGTVGYVAPGFQGRAGKEADVYSFGVLVKIACGIKKHKDEESHLGLVEWAWELYGAGNVLEAAGERLNMDFNKHEMECFIDCWIVYVVFTQLPRRGLKSVKLLRFLNWKFQSQISHLRWPHSSGNLST